MTPWDGAEAIDCGLVGAPLSSGSLQPNSAWGAPDAVRASINGFTTFNPDLDIDIHPLVFRDLGDIRMSATDPVESIDRIEVAISDLLHVQPPFVPIMIGGDHAVTAGAVRALANLDVGQNVGIIYFDSHTDVRELAEGVPLGGQPLRRVLETCPNVRGSNIAQIGLHGFTNSADYVSWARSSGFSLHTARRVRQKGIAQVLREAITAASTGTHALYVSVDLDVLAQAYSPAATGNTTPDGLDINDLLDAVFELGRLTSVRMLDIVEFDPLVDVRNLTARTAVTIMLTFLAGIYTRAQPASGSAACIEGAGQTR
ncbi:MAG: agmatinase family protein [Candidatus Limnocylindrales bacterium]